MDLYFWEEHIFRVQFWHMSFIRMQHILAGENPRQLASVRTKNTIRSISFCLQQTIQFQTANRFCYINFNCYYNSCPIYFLLLRLKLIFNKKTASYFMVKCNYNVSQSGHQKLNNRFYNKNTGNTSRYYSIMILNSRA